MGTFNSLIDKLNLKNLFILILSIAGSPWGCALSPERACNEAFPAWISEVKAEKEWIAQTSTSGSEARSLASVGSPVSKLFESDSDANSLRAQRWASDRLKLIQTVIDHAEAQDNTEAKSVLSRINNELVSYYGYATDLNWRGMSRRMEKLAALLAEANTKFCKTGSHSLD